MNSLRMYDKIEIISYKRNDSCYQGYIYQLKENIPEEERKTLPRFEFLIAHPASAKFHNLENEAIIKELCEDRIKKLKRKAI